MTGVEELLGQGLVNQEFGLREATGSRDSDLEESTQTWIWYAFKDLFNTYAGLTSSTNFFFAVSGTYRSRFTAAALSVCPRL